MSAASSAAPNAIAIVGMGCRFAGAPDLHAYWEMTAAGRHAFGPVPADRWSNSAFFDENRRATDRSYAPAGAFIDDVRSFPALHFGIPPRRVEVMDPQQRLALEIALSAIEDAGYRAKDMPRRTGVFMGVTASEFRVLLSSRVSAMMMATGQFGEVPEDPSALARAVSNVVPSRPFTAPGALANMIAAAVAQELDLHGPAYTVDAACASALIAVSDAVALLRSRQIDAAVAGGVYLQLSPENYIAFSRIGAISGSGVCRPFDARADGFVQGDGAGVIVLKRIEDAERDGDRIYALIHGIAVNNDGRGDGPMAPVLEGQIEVIQAAWQDAGLSPGALGYIEAHGTGTDVGDETELKGLVAALGGEAKRVWLGSAKANVGHTMSAAGIAGIIRATLAVHRGQIPPLAGFSSAKAEMPLSGGPFSVPTEQTPWAGDDRLAGISSFGFGGTNGHVVIGAARSAAVAQPSAQPACELVRISAPDRASLARAARRLADALRADGSITVASVARAWNVRPSLQHRAALTAADRETLIAQLAAIAALPDQPGAALPPQVTVGEAPAGAPKLALLFPGQGAQRVGMLAALAERFPVVRESLAQSERDLADLLPVPLTELLWPEPSLASEVADARLTYTANCQPALVATSVALWRLLQSLGVTPTIAGGHSLGEFAAAVTSGVLSARDAVRFAALRGLAMAGIDGDPGAMAAIVADRDTVAAILKDGAVIANENHPRQTVISGRTDAVQATVAEAAARGLQAKPLRVSHAFHSPLFSGLDPEPWLAAIEVRAPGAVQVASCIAEQPYASREDALAVFRRHASSPVRFGSLLQQCASAGAEVYLQVAAGGPLASFARKGAARDARAVITLASDDDKDGGKSLLDAIGALWVSGVPVDGRALLSAAAGTALASVPPIELPREPYWPVKDEAQVSLKIEAARPVERRAQAQAAPQEAPQAEVSAAKDEVFEKVASIIAKVSSYPRAAIRPELSLTDELGFDSLMVNDLATGLSDAFPGLGGLPQELLLNRPTVQTISEYVRTAASGGETKAELDDSPLFGYKPVWRSCPLPESAPPEQGALAGQTVLLVGERDAEVTAALRALGANVIRRARSPVDILLVLGSFEDPLPVSAVLAGEAEMPDLAGEIIRLIDDQVQFSGRPSIVFLHRKDDPWSHAARGAVRALSREWPDRVAKNIAFDNISPAFRAARLVQELVSEDRSTDVLWGQEGRAISGQERAEEGAPARWSPGVGQRVLVTGGARGIGALLARRLCDAGCDVIVASRVAPSGKAAELFAQKTGPGAITWVCADVTDGPALASALAAHRPFSAAVHSAGILADGPLGSVPEEQGALARRVKIDGLLNTIRASGAPSVLAVGSWAGRFGNRHQMHYCAANAALAALSEHAPPQVRVVLSEFGPWTNSEMAATIPAAVASAMRAEGIDFVGDTSGIDALVEDLCSGTGSVIRGRRLPFWNRIREHKEVLSVDTHPYLADHAIDGVPILPLAAATDLVAFVAGIKPPFEVRDLRLYTGIAVKEPVALRVSVRGERVEIRATENKTLAYRATVAPAGKIELPQPASGGSSPETTIETFYREVTFHGKMFHGLLSVDGVSKDSRSDLEVATGKVKTARPVDFIPKTTRSAWAVDPLALDSAFQLGALLAWDRYRRAGTPVSLGRMIVLAPFPQGPLRAEVRFGPPDGDRSSAQIALRGPDNQVFALALDAVADLKRSEGEAPPLVIKPQWVDPSTWPEVKDLEMRLQAATMLGIDNPYFHVHEGTARNTTVVKGRTLVNFSSYNYLGFSGDPRVLAAVKEAVDRYGTSVSASRVASGERPFHRELEAELAAAQSAEDSLVFTAGHMTNVNVVGHLMKPGDLVLHDELAHDSLLQGIKLSGAGRRAFRHDDPEHLEKLFKELRGHHEKCLVIVEGVYSMDGDLCRLPDYVALKKKYGAMILVDEAHSFGVCGPTGCGIGEHYAAEGKAAFDRRDVDLWMGTLSKSLASCGGWIAGSATMIRYLRYTAPGFVYSAGITPQNGTAALQSLRLMLQEPWRVAKLQSNAKIFHDALVSREVDTGPARGGSGVVPAITGNSMHALLLSQRLRDQGVNVQPIVYPAVADNASRLRFFLSSTHEEHELVGTAEKVAVTLAQIRKEFPAPK